MCGGVVCLYVYVCVCLYVRVCVCVCMLHVSMICFSVNMCACLYGGIFECNRPHRVSISIRMCVCRFTWQAARVLGIIKDYKANIALRSRICVSEFEFRLGGWCVRGSVDAHSAFVRAHY